MLDPAATVQVHTVQPGDDQVIHTLHLPIVQPGAQPAAPRDRQQDAIIFGMLLLVGCCCVCCLLQSRMQRRRRDEHEDEPLLQDGLTSSGAISVNRSRQDVASIGTPARDFVRLSSLPAAIFQLNENRCRACGQGGECVALRPCGHAVLCRPCSDFVFECPHCGQYISGVSIQPRMDVPDGVVYARKAVYSS
jgi:hypothetical protein